MVACNVAAMIRCRAWQPGCGFSTVDVLTVPVPFSLYSGWTTIANVAVANVAVAGVAVGWDGDGLFLSPSAWSAVMVLSSPGQSTSSCFYDQRNSNF